MIQDLVDSARLEEGQLRMDLIPLDVASFTAEVKSRLAGVVETDRIEIAIDEPASPVLADPNRLERILINLLSNALKYSPPESPVRVRAARAGDEMVVSVVDEGVGIPAEEQVRIFDRFYRVAGSRRSEGLGLGLHITRLLVQAHGGRIWVESRVGEGSTFSFTLPVVDTR
jgi:signal transduction histidine kinase